MPDRLLVTPTLAAPARNPGTPGMSGWPSTMRALMIHRLLIAKFSLPLLTAAWWFNAAGITDAAKAGSGIVLIVVTCYVAAAGLLEKFRRDQREARLAQEQADFKANLERDTSARAAKLAREQSEFEARLEREKKDMEARLRREKAELLAEVEKVRTLDTVKKETLSGQIEDMREQMARDAADSKANQERLRKNQHDLRDQLQEKVNQEAVLRKLLDASHQDAVAMGRSLAHANEQLDHANDRIAELMRQTSAGVAATVRVEEVVQDIHEKMESGSFPAQPAAPEASP